MEFRLIDNRARPVPEILLDKATDTGVSDMCLRVGLYLCAHGTAKVQTLVGLYGYEHGAVRGALEYWARAGLAYRLDDEAAPGEPPRAAKAARGANRDGTTAAGGFTAFMDELRRVLGDGISGRDIQIFQGLYELPWLPPEVLLLAVTHFSIAAKTKNANYFARVIETWHKNGITTMEAADRYLQDLYRGNRHVREVAGLLGYPTAQPPFNYAEKAAITAWYKEFGYDRQLIQMAIDLAGEKGRGIAYLNAILKKWHGKGYTCPRDVVESGEGGNAATTAFGGIDPEDDLLLNYVYTPPRPREPDPAGENP